MSNWFVIQTAPQRELVAVNELRWFGYDVYCPTIRDRRGKPKAMFARYVFANKIPRAEHADLIVDRNNRRIIKGALAVFGRYEPIPEEVVGRIAETAARLDMEGDRAPKSSLKVGELGIIKSGPFEGKKVEIIAIEGDAATVALRILNAVRTVRAKIDKLEAAA